MFFRVKLVAIFISVMLILIAAVHLLFVSPITSRFSDQSRQRAIASARALAVMHRNDELAVRGLVEDLTSQQRLRQAMECSNPTDHDCSAQQHRQVLAALDEWYRTVQAEIDRNRSVPIGSRSLHSPFPQPPTLLIVADRDGIVVGRIIGDVSDWYGPDVLNLRASDSATFAVVSDAVVQEAPKHDVIPWQEGVGDQETRTLMLVAASPIRQWVYSGSTGPIVGVALIGFPINPLMAQDKQTGLGEISVAYTLGDRVIASSGGARHLQRCADGRYTNITGTFEVDTLADFLNQSIHDTVYFFLCEDLRFFLIRGQFTADRAGTDPVGYVLVGNLTQALAPLRGLKFGLPALGLALLALGLVALILVVNRFLAPLERIDQGIQQVITGNRDYVWKIDSRNPYHAEMAQALNTMSALLQGKPLPDDESVVADEEWEALLQFAEVEITGQFPALQASEAARLARRKKAEEAAKEPIETFYRRLYGEYMAARAKVGDSQKKLNFDGFVRQIKKKAESYRERHGCKDVRFEVVIKSDKVVLKPIPIK